MMGEREGTTVVLVLACAVAAGGCNRSHDERPPPFMGGGTGTGSPGTVGAINTAGGAGGIDETGESRMTGSVVSFSDTGFRATSPFTETADVSGPAATGEGNVEGVFDGTFYDLPGVRTGNREWLAARPSNPNDFFGAFTQQDTTSGEAELPVVSGTTLDEVFTTANTGTDRAPGTGQLVVRTVDSAGRPVSGVGLSVPGAEFVRFSENGSFFGQDGTTADGLAFAGNVEASAFPGDNRAITLSGPATVSEEVPIAADMVTVLETVVEP